jgi:hypothetical protein
MNAIMRRNVKCDVKNECDVASWRYCKFHDLCSGTNQCDDEIVCLQLQSSNDMMQSNVIVIVDFVLCHKPI